MRSLVLISVLGAAAAACATLPGCATGGPSEPAAPAPAAQPQTGVGVYDTRAVAIAWYRSPEFAKEMAAVRAEHDRAVAAGDRARAADLASRAAAQQERMHAQGFGTAPVDDVLARVAAEMPGALARAGVESAVSKWSAAAPSGAPDVTDALVALFRPDAATLEMTRQIRSKRPETGVASRD